MKNIVHVITNILYIVKLNNKFLKFVHDNNNRFNPFKVNTYKEVKTLKGFFHTSLNTNLMTLVVTINVIMLSERNG